MDDSQLMHETPRADESITDDSPQPTWWVYLATGVVLVSCLTMLATCIAGILTEDPDLFFAYAGAIIVFPVVLLALSATFQRSSGSALTLALLCLSFGGLIAFIAAQALVDLDAPIDMILCSSAVSAVSLLCCVAMVGWRRQLKQAIESGIDTRPRGQSAERRSWAIVACVSYLLGMSWFITSAMPPHSAQHVSAKETPYSLPDGATDVSYRKGSRGTLWYECACTEEAFRAWAESGILIPENGSDITSLREIESVRYKARDAVSVPGEEVEHLFIDDGLECGWTIEDRGQHLIYDRKTGRAFYYCHSH